VIPDAVAAWSALLTLTGCDTLPPRQPVPSISDAFLSLNQNFSIASRHAPRKRHGSPGEVNRKVDDNLSFRNEGLGE
jgi:hypothetical protein